MNQNALRLTTEQHLRKKVVVERIITITFSVEMSVQFAIKAILEEITFLNLIYTCAGQAIFRVADNRSICAFVLIGWKLFTNITC